MDLSEFAGRIEAARGLAIHLVRSGPDPHVNEITGLQLTADGIDEVYEYHGELNAEVYDKKTLGTLRRLLENAELLIFHNAQMELQFLRKLEIFPQSIFDISLASQLLHFSVQVQDLELSALAGRYHITEVAEPYQKDEGHIKAGREGYCLLRLCQVLTSELRQNGLMDIAEIEFNCTKATAQMEYNGIWLDLDKWNRLYDQARKAQQSAMERLYEFSGRPMVQLTLWGEEESLDINFNSNTYVLSLLRKHGIMVKSTGKRELYPYREHPLVGALSEYRKQSKSISSFLQPLREMLHPVTGRLHPHYGQLTAYSGRMSCWNPNIQQIPRETAFRDCFTAPAGMCLLIADYSQIELRVAAQISRDVRMLAAYRNGEDLHTMTASILSGKPAGEVTGQERQAAKSVNFGLIFGMGPRGLMDYARMTYGVEMSLEQAGDFSRRFFAAYDGIGKWHSWLKQHQETEGRTLTGRRFYYSRLAPLPEVSNLPVQGTAADILKKALGLLADRLDRDIRIVAVIHDEILLECPAEKGEAAAGVLKRAMEEAANTILPLVPANVDVSIAMSWAGK